MKITSDSIVVRDNDQLFSEIDSEIVMLSVVNGEYYNLNQFASKIWNLIEEPIIVQKLINSLLIEFKDPLSKCENDTISFVEELIEKKLAKIVEKE